MQDVHNTADGPPSVGWICTNLSIFTMAKAMLDEEHTDPSVKPGQNMVSSGRIGTVNVVINCLSQPLHSGDVANAAQTMITNSTGIKSILVTSYGNGLISHNIKLGDLAITQPNVRDGDDSEPVSTRKWSILQQAALLQREVGADGSWLSSNLPAPVLSSSDLLQFTQRPNNGTASYPQLHYGSVGQAGQNSLSELWDKMIAAENVPDFEAAAKGLMNPPIDVIILAASKYADSSETSEEYAAANAASYAKELIRGFTMDDLTNSIASIRGTETIVPPLMEPKVPPFEAHQFPRHGNAILLVIPTANESKGRLIRKAFEGQKLMGVAVHSMIVPFDSGVGEQPYNEAGVLGAHSRISNVLRHLDAPEYQETFLSKGIGTLIVASIESFIQLDNVDRPTDYGVVVIHNATVGKTAACLSWGATVPPAYVNRARRFGFEGNPNHGRVTVGQILAAHVPGLDKANWQAVLAGRSRYDLLSDAISHLTIPW